VDKISEGIFFILMVLLFGCLLYLGLLITGQKKGEEKWDSPDNYFGKSVGAAFFIGIIVIIFGVIFMLLFIAAALEITGGGSGDPLTGLLSNSLGQTAASVFESEWRVMAMVGGFGLVILLSAGYILKGRYNISLGWAVLILVVAFGIYFGLDYLIGEFVYGPGITGAINWVGEALESWVWDMAFGT